MKELQTYTNAKKATVDLPFGMFANETKAGGNDGTPIIAEHMQDLYYSLYQVLQLAGEIPNGELEDGNGKKQFLQSLSKIGVTKYTNTVKYSLGNIVFQTSGSEITLYRSLKSDNNTVLTDTSFWQKVLTIGDKIIFHIDTNINSSGSNYPVFCFNSGAVDENGEAALLSYSEETKQLTLLSPCVYTTARGETVKVSEDISIDLSDKSEGNYNIFINKTSGGLELYSNRIFESKIKPEDMTEYDIWLNTSVMPYISYQLAGSELREVELVPIGSMTYEAGGG